MNEDVMVNKENQEDFSLVTCEEDFPALGVRVSESLWEEKTVKGSDEIFSKIGTKRIYSLRDLQDGHVVFIENKNQKVGINAYAYRVNRIEREDENNNGWLKLIFEPSIDRSKEIQLIWPGNDIYSPEAKWDGSTKLDSSNLYFYPAPDVTVLMEVGAYSHATTMKM